MSVISLADHKLKRLEDRMHDIREVWCLVLDDIEDHEYSGSSYGKDADWKIYLNQLQAHSNECKKTLIKLQTEYKRIKKFVGMNK